MTEPTKGPWKEHYIPSYSSHIVGADGKTVADCFDERDWDSNKCTYAEGECQANIDLIAASPDLLAALENLLSEALAWADSVQYDRDTSWEYNAEPVIVAARAAIAKAKGETND